MGRFRLVHSRWHPLLTQVVRSQLLVRVLVDGLLCILQHVSLALDTPCGVVPLRLIKLCVVVQVLAAVFVQELVPVVVDGAHESGRVPGSERNPH